MGCVEMAMYPSKQNKNLVPEFYANLSDSVNVSTNPAFGAVYVKGTPIAFTPSNIASFMSCSTL